MSALEEYLKQFYDNPDGIEEFKINFLKNHYYDQVASILNIERKEMVIGVTNNRSLIYFKTRDPKSVPIILDRINNKFI